MNKSNLSKAIRITTFLLFILLYFKSSAQNSDDGFKENLGQVTDQTNRLRSDVLFTYENEMLSSFLLNDGISYQINKVESFTNMEDPRGEGSFKKVPDKIRVYRIDSKWLGMNKTASLKKGNSHDFYELFYKSDNETKVKTYQTVTYENIYNNIDLKYYINDEGILEYDFIVNPKADYRQIKIEIHGAEIQKNTDGSIILSTPIGNIEQSFPIVKQNGKEYVSKWIITGNVLSFELNPEINKNETFIIDPLVRLWGTYFGSTGLNASGVAGIYDEALGVALDNGRNVYITGWTTSTSNIATSGAFDQTLDGNQDAYLAKFNSSGGLQWATYFGGSGNEMAYSVATNQTENTVYITGYTSSSSSVASGGPAVHQNFFGGGASGNPPFGGDAFLAKFNTTGGRVWSTYYGGGGNDLGSGVCVAPSGNVFICGWTNSTNNISGHTSFAGGNWDGFAAEFTTSGTREWGRYLGGPQIDVAAGIAVGADGNPVVIGQAQSAILWPAVNGHSGGLQDAFVAKLGGAINPVGAGNIGGLRYIGGSASDSPGGVTVSTSNEIYVTGWTGSNNNISSLNSFIGGSSDAYLVKLDGNLISGGFPLTNLWSTYLGGGALDQGRGVAVDNTTGNVYVGGNTLSASGISTPPTHQASFGGGGNYGDGFLMKYNSSGVKQWGTYYGGTNSDIIYSVASGGQGYLYACGATGSTNAIATSGLTPPVHDVSYGGGTADAFLARFSDCDAFVTTASNTGPVCTGVSFSVSTPLIAGATYSWTGPNGYSSSVQNPPAILSTATNGGLYTVTVTNAGGCVTMASTTVTVNPIPAAPLLTISSNGCPGGSIYLNTPNTNVAGTQYVWAGPGGWTQTTSVNYTSRTAAPGTNGTYSLYIVVNGCTSATSTQSVNLNSGFTNLVCPGTQYLNANASCKYNVGNPSPLNFVGFDDYSFCEFSGITGWTVTYQMSGATVLPQTTSDYFGIFGIQLNLGTTTITWRSYFNGVLQSTCSFNAIVTDVTLPNITNCAALTNQTVNTSAGSCTYTHSGTAWNATASDNCSIASIVYTLTGATTGTGTSLNGVAFNLGTTTITWTATDGSGNTATCVKTVTVNDNTLPIITNCGTLQNQVVNSSAGSCDYTHSGTAWDANATDNCPGGGFYLSYTLTGATTGTGSSLNGVIFNVGTTTVTWTATDGSGNIATCIKTVTVNDITPPIISNCASISSPVIVNVSSSNCLYTQPDNSWNPTVTDNCNTFLIIPTYSLSGATTGTGTDLNGVTFNLGITTITWTAIDSSGNMTTCIKTVTVNDATAPTVTNCATLTNQTVNTASGSCTYTHSGTAWNATASDNCGSGTLTLNYVLTGATTGTGTSLNGVVFNLGLTTVTWTATDAAGNSTTCVKTVTVNDATAPTVTNCAALTNQTVNTASGSCTYTHSGTAWNATASDNCGGVVTIGYSLSGATTGTGTSLNGVVFNLGLTTVTWTATDAAGNTSTCIKTVTVNDATAPTVTNCATLTNQTVNTASGSCTYTHSGTAWNATASDNCGSGTLTLNYVLTGATTGTGTSLNGVVFNLGLTTVTWTATDAAGNATTCVKTVTVNDATAPTVTNCAALTNQTVNTASGSCTYTHSGTAWNATASDNCGGVVTIGYSLSGATTGTGTSLNGVVFNLGLTTVTWTATDAAGNTSTCIKTVTVNDATAPTVTNCATLTNQTVNTASGSCTYTHSGTAWNATASDNCGSGTLTLNYVLTGATTGTGTSLNGVVFNLGLTTVTWTATDAAGNSTTCVKTVTVNDATAPTVTNCAALTNQTVNTASASCTYTHSGTAWNATASDNCGGAVTLGYSLSGATTGSGSSLNGVVFNLGLTTVTWTATDAAGNSTTCIKTVTVNDATAPTVTNCATLTNQTVNTASGSCTYTHSGTAWNATASDNCGGVVTIGYSLSGSTTGTGTSLNGVVFNLGLTTVTWTATDAAGNSTTCVKTVTVNDATAPTVTNCAALTNQTVNTASGSCTYTHSGTAWNATASDNCGGAVTLGYSLSGATTGSGASLNGVVFNLGLTTVTWTATDAAGNSTTCIKTVTVNDSTAPVITNCATLTIPPVQTNDGCTYIHSGTGWNPTVTDNCSVGSLALTYVLTGATIGNGTDLDGVVFNLGVTSVTWTATDAAGNATICVKTVTVNDETAPTIINCAALTNQTVNTGSGTCTYTHSGTAWNATALDNCGSGTLTLNYALTGATVGTGTDLNGIIFNLGTTNVVWVALDASGNTDSCRHTVNVIDNISPQIINCASIPNPTITTAAGICTYTNVGNYLDATAIDNCSSGNSLQLTYSLSGATTGTGTSLNGVSFNLGLTTISWIATDQTGNSDTCIKSLNLTDTIAPTLVNCQNDTVTLTSLNGNCTYTVSGTSLDVTATDNCGNAVVSTYTLSGATTGTGNSLNGVTFNPGITSVLWIASNSGGYSDSCSYDVLVQDGLQPNMINCQAATVTYQANNSNCSYSNSGNSLDVTATDNCGNTVVSTYTLTGATTGTGTSLNGIVFNNGLTTVSWIAINNANVSDTCIYQISIINALDSINTNLDITPVNCNTIYGAAEVIYTGPNSPITVLWSNSQITNPSGALIAGNYSVNITDAIGCTNEKSFIISGPTNVSVEITGSQNPKCLKEPDGFINSETIGGTTPYSYDWSNGGNTANISGLNGGTYTLIVSDINMCSDTISITLQCDLGFIPEFVSPNGNGQNDTWEIPGLDNYPGASVEIYNRWGNKVFGQEPYQNNWSGKSNTPGTVGNNPLPSGTYFYILDLKNGEKPMNGFIELTY